MPPFAGHFIFIGVDTRAKFLQSTLLFKGDFQLTMESSCFTPAEGTVSIVAHFTQTNKQVLCVTCCMTSL